MKRLTIFACVVFAAMFSITVLSSEPPQQPLTFEAATMKQNHSANDSSAVGCYAGMASDGIPKGRCVAKYVNLRFVILYAYGYKTMIPLNDYISGAPDWLLDEKYDIEAKAENDSATEEQLREMLRNLLADDCKLRLHETSMDIPGFALKISKGGPKLKEAAADERGGAIITSQPPGLKASHTSMKDFADVLTQVLHHPVSDKTELTGFYDFTIVWGTEESIAAEMAANGNQIPEEAIKGALQSQIGLVRQSQKVPKKQLVIDHVEKPTEN